MVGDSNSLLAILFFSCEWVICFFKNKERRVLIYSLFHLDTNEDGVLDEQELEALFTKEVYNPAYIHIMTASIKLCFRFRFSFILRLLKILV